MNTQKILKLWTEDQGSSMKITLQDKIRKLMKYNNLQNIYRGVLLNVDIIKQKKDRIQIKNNLQSWTKSIETAKKYSKKGGYQSRCYFGSKCSNLNLVRVILVSLDNSVSRVKSLDLEDVKGYSYYSDDREVILDRPVFKILFSKYKYDHTKGIYYIPVIFYKTSNVNKRTFIEKFVSPFI